MKLHENQTLFRQAVRFTAQEMEIPDLYIEKDYWVTFALKQIFSKETKDYCVFKGGTALSKCYGIVERFSEDIDLVIMKTGDESANQLKNRLKKVSQIIEEYLPEVAVTNITQKMVMNRKTAHAYSKEFQGNYGQIRDVIIVEASWLSYFEPFEQKSIRTFISEMMLRNGQESLIEEYELEEFAANVLKTERTLCEKIMSLVRFSYSEDYIADLKSKIRHTYDIHQLLQEKDIVIENNRISLNLNFEEDRINEIYENLKTNNYGGKMQDYRVIECIRLFWTYPKSSPTLYPYANHEIWKLDAVNKKFLDGYFNGLNEFSKF